MKQGDIVYFHAYNLCTGECFGYRLPTLPEGFVFGGLIGHAEFAYWRIKSIKPTPTKALLNK